MNEYMMEQGKAAWFGGKNMTYVGYQQPKRPTTVKDVREWLTENWTFGNEWAGFPENEMARHYHNETKMAYLWFWFDQTGTEFQPPNA